jgi:protein O-mannosyl-transferase
LGSPVMTRSLKQHEAEERRLAGDTPLFEPWVDWMAKPFFNPWRLAFLGILILAIVAYLPSLQGQRVWDDYGLLDGSSVGGGTTVLDALTKPFLGAYFRPLVSLSFHFENQLWHGVPFLYHQTNILIHMLATAGLIGLVLTSFNKPALALLSGLLFAVQPAQVSTVAWIGGRTDSLCSLLVILFAYSLVLGNRTSGVKRTLWLGASVIAFFLAALTKEQILAMILLVPMAARAFRAPGQKLRLGGYAKLVLPYMLASAVFVILWFAYNANPYEALGRGFFGQLMVAGQSTVYYSLLFLAPSGKWMHTLSLGTMDQPGLPLTLAGVALLVAYVAGVAFSMRKNPQLGWFAAFVALALLPVINLVPLPSLLVAPYRAGVAGVGVAVLLAWVITNLPTKQMSYVTGTMFALWCGWLTFWGSMQWKDPVTVFTRITQEDPYSIVARRNNSSYLMKEGRPKEASEQMKGILTTLYGSDAWQEPDVAFAQFESDPVLRRRVVENQGNDVEPETWLAELFAQLGFCENSLVKIESSRKAFESAIRINPKNPRANVGLSEYALFEKRYSAGIRHLRIAMANHPNDPGLYRRLGRAYVLTSDLRRAKLAYEKSIELEPWFGLSHEHLAEVQAKQGDVAGALMTLRTALNCQVRDEASINARIQELENRQKRGGH